MKRWSYAVAGASGFFMGVGLVLGRLTRPDVITGWVDFFGSWDPTLLVFFAAALVVYHPIARWAQARERAGRGVVLCLPTSRAVDAKLLLGASIFGVGWGLGGACPGPAFASLGAGAAWAAPFLAAMMVGLFLGGLRAQPPVSKPGYSVMPPST